MFVGRRGSEEVASQNGILVGSYKGIVVNVDLPFRVGVGEFRGYFAQEGIYGVRLGGSGVIWCGGGGLDGSG